MRKIFVVAVLVTSLSGFANAQSREQEVQQAVIKLFDALSDRDAIALRNQCTVDVRFLEYGKVWPADTLVNLAITKNVATDFKRSNKIDFITTKIRGDVAWVTYNLYSVIFSKGNERSVQWLESVVLVRENKKWKIDLLHSTRISKG